MSDINLSRVLTPVHPVFDNSITEDDILQWSVIAGLPPVILTGIIQGRILPDDLVTSRIARVFSDDQVNAIINDYDPLRGMIFNNYAPTKNHQIYPNYPASLLVGGDQIRADDGRWLVLSSTTRPPGMVHLYSGGISVSRISDRDEVIASIPINRGESEVKEDNQKKRLEKAEEQKQNREIFINANLTPTRMDTAEKIRDMLAQIRDGSH